MPIHTIRRVLAYNMINHRVYVKNQNADLAICLNQYNELNQLIVAFGKQLRERTTYLNDTALNCNNMLMFESNNSRYLAYISEIDYKLPFNMKPFASGYNFDLPILQDVTHHKNQHNRS